MLTYRQLAGSVFRWISPTRLATKGLNCRDAPLTQYQTSMLSVQKFHFRRGMSSTGPAASASRTPTIAAISSRRGTLMALSGATLALANTKRDTTSSGYLLTRYATAPYASREASTYMCSSISSGPTLGCNVRGTDTAASWGSSRNHTTARKCSSSGTGVSHSTPAAHISCRRILALMVKGARNPKGSKRVEVLLRNCRLVVVAVSSGGCTRNVNPSQSASHATPNVFTIGSTSASRSNLLTRSSSGIAAITCRSLDAHFLGVIPALRQRSSRSL